MKQSLAQDEIEAPDWRDATIRTLVQKEHTDKATYHRHET
jgi:hypothetical protein